MNALRHALTPERIAVALTLAGGLYLAAVVPYHWLELFVVAIVHLGLIPAVAYPVHWRLNRTPWRESKVGRALMRKAEALALLFIVSVLNVWLPGVWWAPVYAITVTYVVVTLWRQYLVLRTVLRERARDG